jgi:hypothetical protein
MEKENSVISERERRQRKSPRRRELVGPLGEAPLQVPVDVRMPDEVASRIRFQHGFDDGVFYARIL